MLLKRNFLVWWSSLAGSHEWRDALVCLSLLSGHEQLEERLGTLLENFSLNLQVLSEMEVGMNNT